jgi:hypothetical protein
MKFKKILAALLASSLAIGALTGCGGSKKEAGKDGDVIKVGVFLPLTGR